MGEFRVAVVTSTDRSLAEVRAYMPSNFSAFLRIREIFIVGVDSAGWTLDDYVLPRLGSGMIAAREISPDQWVYGLDYNEEM